MPSDFPEKQTTTNIPPVRASKEEVYKALMSFPNGSAGGLDSFRPQILKDLCHSNQGDASNTLLTKLSNLCNLMLKGIITEDICP